MRYINFPLYMSQLINSLLLHGYLPFHILSFGFNVFELKQILLFVLELVSNLIGQKFIIVPNHINFRLLFELLGMPLVFYSLQKPSESLFLLGQLHEFLFILLSHHIDINRLNEGFLTITHLH